MIKLLVDGIPEKRGGIGTMIIDIVSRLDKSVFQIDFLSTCETDYAPVIISMGSAIHYIPPFRKCLLTYAHGLKRLFTKQTYDYIWINNSSKANMILPYLGKKYAGAQIIFHSHGTNNEFVGLKKNLISVMEKCNEKLFYQLADIPCACSVDSANYFYDVSKLKQGVHIIKNSIDVETFKFCPEIREGMRAEYHIKDEEVLGTVGRLSEVKNQKFLIDLIGKLHEECGKKYKLLIVGDGPLKEELKEYTAQMGLSRDVIFTGDVSNVKDYLQMFDFFLLPSYHEGLPLVLVEAQACGLKCLVSDTVSKEADILKTMSFLPLKNIELWKNVIINQGTRERSLQYEKVIAAGYNIETSAKEFEILLRQEMES